MLKFFNYLGTKTINFIREIGEISIILFYAFFWLFRRPFRAKNFIQAMYFVGAGSIFIIALTGLFTGMVMALQGYYVFSIFQAETMIGPSVSLSLSRELAPVLTALMVTGRVGSAMATELGTMRVTEQIDALEAMAINPIQFLITPRIVATVIMVPILCAFFIFIGIVGAYLVAVVMLNTDEGMFFEKIRFYTYASDILSGLLKSMFFGLILSLIGCYKGYKAEGGARGVGIATTQSVVYSSVLILIADYFLTIILF